MNSFFSGSCKPARAILALILFCSIGSAWAAPVLLTNWTVEQYSTGGQGDSEWIIQPGDTSVEQTQNSNSSTFLSDFTIVHSPGTGFTTNVNVSDLTDNDQIGMVFGYQDRSNFYLFQWKGSGGIFADDGMHLRRITAVGDPSAADLEGPQATGTGTASMFMFAQNDLMWNPNVDYQFTVTFTPTGFDFDVTDGNSSLANWSINDLTFVAGKVGFYNSSQRDALYSGVVIPIPAAALMFFSAIFSLFPLIRRVKTT